MEEILSLPPLHRLLNSVPRQECIIIFSDQSKFTLDMKTKPNETFHKMVLHHLAACYNLTRYESREEITFCTIPIKTVGDEIILVATWTQSYDELHKAKIVTFLLKKIKKLMLALENNNIDAKISVHYIKDAFQSKTYLEYIKQLTKGEWTDKNGFEGLKAIRIKSSSIDTEVAIPISQHDLFGSEVNYAKRITSIAKGHMVLLSEEVYQLISDENGEIKQELSEIKEEFECENNKFSCEKFYSIKSFEDFKAPKKIYQLPIRFAKSREYEKIQTINIDLNILTLIYAERSDDISVIERALFSNEKINSSCLLYGYKDLEPIIHPSAALDDLGFHRQAILLRWGYYDLDTYRNLVSKNLWNIERPIKHVKSNILVDRYPFNNNIAISDTYSGFLCLLKFSDISYVTREDSFVCKRIKDNKEEIMNSLREAGFPQKNEIFLIEVGTLFGEYDVFIIFAYRRPPSIDQVYADYLKYGRSYAKNIANTILKIYGKALQETNGIEIWPLIDLKILNMFKYLEPKGNEEITIYK